MNFNDALVRDALYAAFGTKNVGDTLKFPGVDPVYSNGADVASAPSIANLSGIPIVTYELRSRYFYMKYAFSTDTLALAGILDDAVFQEKVKNYFMTGLQEYLLTVVTDPNTVYKSPSINDVTFEFNNTTVSGTAVKIARAYVNIRYWFKLP